MRRIFDCLTVMWKIINKFNLIYQVNLKSLYLSKVLHLMRKDATVANDLINLIKNRDNLKKWLLATSDFDDKIQDDLNAVVGTMRSLLMQLLGIR